jgi:hypothetical protein
MPGVGAATLGVLRRVVRVLVGDAEIAGQREIIVLVVTAVAKRKDVLDNPEIAGRDFPRAAVASTVAEREDLGSLLWRELATRFVLEWVAHALPFSNKSSGTVSR